METHKCFYCSFAFNETEKEWDVATKTNQCPRCRKVLPDFPPGRQQRGTQAAPTISEYRKQSSRQEQREQTYSTQEAGTAPSLWNPAALANWSLFLTPLFGSYLLAENYKAMGKPEEAKKAMEWFYVGIAIFLSVFLSVIIFSPSGLFGVALLTYLLYLVSWNFMSARKQQRAVLSEYGNNYERQPWGKVLAIGIAAIIVWQIIVRVPSSNVTSSLFPTTSFDSAEVKRVKSGVMQLCPSHTVDQMVKGFMGSPSWKSGKSADGKVFVNVEGDITFQDKPVRAMVQFIVEGESFSFSAFEMNGVPSANLIAIGLLNKMCVSAEGSVAEKTATLIQPGSAKPVAFQVTEPLQLGSKRDFQNEATQDLKFVNPTQVTIPSINFSAFQAERSRSFVSSVQIEQAFRHLMGNDFEELLDNLAWEDALLIDSSGKIVFGSGAALHSVGVIAGAYMIDQNGYLYAILMDKSAQPRFRIYGTVSYDRLPIKLREFISENRT